MGGGGATGLLNKGGGSNRLPVEFPQVVMHYYNVFFTAAAASGGDPSLFSYAQTSYFTVKLLGHIPDVPAQSNMGSTESQISTLEAIDAAQVCTLLSLLLMGTHFS